MVELRSGQYDGVDVSEVPLEYLEGVLRASGSPSSPFSEREILAARAEVETRLPALRAKKAAEEAEQAARDAASVAASAASEPEPAQPEAATVEESFADVAPVEKKKKKGDS